MGKTFPQSLESKLWYRTLIVSKEDQIEVLIDGKTLGSFRSPGIGHPVKSDFGFVTKGNMIEIDEVRVTKLGVDQPPTRPAP